MPQEGHFDEEGLVDLFCGDCSFEDEVGADDDDHKDNDCAAEVELEVEVVQETMLKRVAPLHTPLLRNRIWI